LEDNDLLMREPLLAGARSALTSDDQIGRFCHCDAGDSAEHNRGELDNGWIPQL
jgi:hypothetical protein